MQLTNPILPGYYPDPSVCRVGEDFYLVTSSFEYFPGVPIFKSRDLVNWEQLGHCLTRESQLNVEGVKASGGIFAPTIRHINGRFYMVTTDTTGIGNFYVHAEDPEGEWSEPVKVTQGGIDPSLFEDEDGQVYFTSNALWYQSQRGIYMNRIDLATGELEWKEAKFLWEGSGGKYPEAPHIYKREGWYYLLIAEGGTEFGHMVTIARSRKIDGPYEACPDNPILSHRSTASAIQSTGHAEMFEDTDGNWWMVFLGVRHVGYPLVHFLGRETYLAPVDWTLEGWPVVNGGHLVELKMEVDRPGDSRQVRADEWRDDFSTIVLRPEWNFCRNPEEGSWVPGCEPGGLRLDCRPVGLDGLERKAWVGRRQQHFYARGETEIAFQPRGKEEAGLTAYMNERFHAEVAVAWREGRRVVVFRKRCGSLVNETIHALAGEGPVVLAIESDEEWLRFFFQRGGGGPREVGSIETRFLSTEMAGGFTGVYWALFATSNGGPGGNSAVFSYFHYKSANDTREWDRTLEPVTTKPGDTE